MKYPSSSSKNSKFPSLHATLSGVAIAAGALALSTGAMAQSASSSQSSNTNYFLYAPGSAYVGLNAGRSNYDAPTGTGGFASDRHGNAYSIYGGSYMTNNLGWELGYNDFGSISRAGGSTKANALSLSLVGKLPLSPSFNLLGRVGASYVRTDVSAAAGSGITAGGENKFGLSYGLGAEYAFNPQLSAVLQYDEYNAHYAGSGNEKIGTTSLGLRFRF